MFAKLINMILQGEQPLDILQALLTCQGNRAFVGTWLKEVDQQHDFLLAMTLSLGNTHKLNWAEGIYSAYEAAEARFQHSKHDRLFNAFLTAGLPHSEKKLMKIADAIAKIDQRCGDAFREQAERYTRLRGGYLVGSYNSLESARDEALNQIKLLAAKCCTSGSPRDAAELFIR